MINVFTWIFSVIPSLILLQTLFFKFTASEESIYIFTKLGMEPAGRIGSGVVELVAGIFLLIPKLRVYGAILALGVISGAVLFHLTILGIEVKGDGGLLFYYALIVLFCSLFVLILRRREIPIIGEKL